MAELGQIVTGQIDLIELIKRAEIINEDEKKRYLELLPSLSKEQLQEVADFFSGAERELQEIREDYEKKKVEVYEKHIQGLKQTVTEAKTMVRKELEGKQVEHDDSEAEGLIQSINNS